MGFLAVVALVVFALHEPERRVGPLPPPTAEDGAYARIVMQTLRHISRQPDQSGDLLGTLDQFNGLLRLLGRTYPSVAGEMRIDAGTIHIDASVRPPWGNRLGWLNVSAVVPAHQGALRLESLRVGRLALPPATTLRLLTWGVDQRFGHDYAAQTLRMLRWLEIGSAELTLGIALSDGGETVLSRPGLAELYGQGMPGVATVRSALGAFENALAEERLQTRGSLVPWLRVMLEHAAEEAAAGHDDPELLLLAGLMALHQYCGARHNLVGAFAPSMSRELPPRADLTSQCHRVMLAERSDLRSRFVSAALIEAVSGRGVSLAAGELKELMDTSVWGFDFTDIAAHFAGTRFATLLSATPPVGWRALAARLDSEHDVMISLRGIPGALSEARFRFRFGDVDSPEYAAMIEAIEARIDALPIHAAAQDG